MIGQRWDAWCEQHRAGRDDYPRLLADLYYRHDRTFRDDHDELAYALADAWQMPDHPTLGALEPLDWTHMFQRVGYVVNGHRAESERPAESLTLYRGAHPSHRRGMSWTDQLDIACWFTSYRSPGGSQVYVATVPPAAILARIDGEDSRAESEYVVDMRGVRTRVLSITPEATSENALRQTREIHRVLHEASDAS